MELESILSEQSPAGAFRSLVQFGGHSSDDWNGFTTAHVLRELRGVPASSRLARARARALDFLASCAAPERPGAFGFWPRAERPAWAANVPADADDTAVIAVELARHGRLGMPALRRIACAVLAPQRLRALAQPAPPWLRPGVFLTWLHAPGRPNIVDCCVNANVLALLAYAGMTHLPGYRQALALIADGLRWAGADPARRRSLIPFYAHPAELLVAVEHAIVCGVDALIPVYDFLREHWQATCSPDRPLWSNAYGRVVWRSPALQAARRLKTAHAVMNKVAQIS